jgi:hypothetical protein
LSGQLSRIIQKGLTKDLAHRYQSAEEFRKALCDYLSGIGLTEDVFSLPLWIREPGLVTMDALRISAEKITKTAELAAKNRKWNECLEHLAHLSLKAPQSPAISRLMGLMKVTKRGRWKIYALTTGVFLAITLFVATPYWLKFHTPSQPPPAQPQAVPTPKPSGGEVHFQVGEGIEVLWDDKPVNPKVPLKEPVLGKHILILKRKGFAPIRSEIFVNDKEPAVINVQ